MISLNYQNNYVGRSNWLLENQSSINIKIFFCLLCLSFFIIIFHIIIFIVQQNYFYIRI